MRRKIYLISIAAVIFIAGVFLWRLDIPNWKKLDISLLTDISRSTVVYDKDGNAAGLLFCSEDRTLVDLKNVPAHVKNAFIAAEDLRFYHHDGFDIKRMFGALFHNIRTMDYSQGASTITQQLIKLTHLTGEKKISRKVQEIFLAAKLERIMEKDEILEAYLNVVYFGRGAYGIASASKNYFGKDVRELTAAEGALLAGIIKSPSSYAPHINPEKSVARRNLILDTMFENGFIGETTLNAAKAESLSLSDPPAKNTEFAWYMDSVLSEAESILKLDAEAILSGGYNIHTGLDTHMQNEANMLFENAANFPSDASDGTPVQAALIALDTETGEVRAVIGGRNYEVRRGLNRATQIKRQPGSVFKPVSVFAAAVDAFHFVPSSAIEDTPRTFSGNYSPGNAGGASYGTVTLREALSKSLNIASVDLADLIGMEAVRNYAIRFGLELSDQDQNLSTALGFLTDGLSPIDLTGAYCALSNGGMKTDPHFIKSIFDSDGSVIYSAEQTTERVVQPESAFMITDMLKTAASTGSAKALSASGIPVAGKTGTIEHESGGTKDIWTSAYTPDIAVTVWMGFDQTDNTHILPSSEGGSGYPARLCAGFIKGISDAISGNDFIRPSGISTVMIDRLSLEKDHSARLITEKTPEEYIIRELFRSDMLPAAFSEYWTNPAPITDLRRISPDGEVPVIVFTAADNHSEYIVCRESEGITRDIAVLSASAGEIIQFSDVGHDLSESARYTVIPRNRYLYENGEILTGEESTPVSYAPGGLLGILKSAGADNAAPAQDRYDILPDQSLFG